MQMADRAHRSGQIGRDPQCEGQAWRERQRALYRHNWAKSPSVEVGLGLHETGGAHGRRAVSVSQTGTTALGGNAGGSAISAGTQPGDGATRQSRAAMNMGSRWAADGQSRPVVSHSQRVREAVRAQDRSARCAEHLQCWPWEHQQRQIAHRSQKIAANAPRPAIISLFDRETPKQSFMASHLTTASCVVQSNKIYLPREALLVSTSFAARQISAIRQAAH